MPPKVVDHVCCRSGQMCARLPNHRSFSTSFPLLAQIPPESPRFIEIPRAIQPVQPFPVHMKGILPVPRPILRRRSRPQDPDKASPAYLANVTPEPIKDKRTPEEGSPKAEFVSWKARQSDQRRRNLRESLVELNYRNQRTNRISTARLKRRAEERQQLITAPELEDERLTNPSVLQSEKPTRHNILPDPDREARLAQKRENVARMEAFRQEERQNKLHTLYVNASNFITTAKQLDTVVDTVFDDPDQFTSDAQPGLNVWNLGYPETVLELLNRANKDPRSQKALSSAEGNAAITRRRMRRVAEELTGGKMAGSR